MNKRKKVLSWHLDLCNMLYSSESLINCFVSGSQVYVAMLRENDLLFLDQSSSSANVDQHFLTTCRKKRVKVTGLMFV